MTFADAGRRRWAQGTKIGGYEHLMQRVDAEAVEALFEPPPGRPADKVVPGGEDLAPETIKIDDFAKIDLRIAEIVKRANWSTARQDCCA